MAGRPSKPTALLVIEGKSHKAKAELEQRKKAEQSLYTGESFTESAEVKADKIAHKEYTRLKRLYKKIQYVDALDMQMINRYCKGISELVRLRDMLDRMETRLDDADMDGGELVKLYTAINNILGKIQQQEKLLISYEDRLFLNPAGRMRAIPKTPEKKEVTGIEAYRSRRNNVQ